MVKQLCIPCNLEFPSDAVYKQHKIEIHHGKIPMGTGTAMLPQGVTQDMLPSPEFMEVVNSIEHKGVEGNSFENPIVTPSISSHNSFQRQIVQALTPQPITLTYTYAGTCPDHPALSVETLLVDVAKGQYALAFCAVCKMTKEQQKVPYLHTKSSADEKPVKTSKNASQKGKKVGDE